MKNLTLLLILLTAFQGALLSQSCLPEGITFETQTEIDSFQVNYPGCAEIEGNLRIDGDTITNLNGLSVVISIGGNLLIEGNNVLTSLAGLDSVTFVGGDLYIGDFSYEGNPVLTDITGLNALASVGGGLSIDYNDALSSLTGLNNVTSVGGKLHIYNNDALTSLSGLASLTSIGGDLVIQSNGVLSSLSGLDNINASSIEDLNICYNSNLSTCEVQSICEYLANPLGIVDIIYNQSGCDNPPEIANACGISLPCLPFGDYHFLTQAEIDGFQTNYPDCMVLEGRVIIEDNQIHNLNGLNAVTSIGGSLQIDNAFGLTNLAGLENLTSIEGNFAIFNSGNLTSLSGLDNLTLIGGQLQIYYNHFLENLVGLGNVTSIGGHLEIGENQALTTLDGLDNVTTIGGHLDITENKSLTNLTKLENLTSIGGFLRINDNDDLTSLTGIDNINDSSIAYLDIGYNYLLSICEVQSICDYLGDSSAIIRIYYNANGCNSQEEVELACATISVNDLDYLNTFSIYPNPSFTQITIENTKTTPKFQISIFNLNGQEVIKQQVTEPKTVVDISTLPQGIYMVKLTSDDKVKVLKLVKE